MQLAIIADIHANLPALQAVLDDAADCDAVVCCGDVVGYYGEPNECCQLLRQCGIPTVRGNHDCFAIGELDPAADRESLYRAAWTRQSLSQANLNWLRSLPTTMQFQWGDLSLIVRHACPWDEVTYLYPDSTDLERINLNRDEILAVGHTHRPMLRPAGQGRILNPGAVGQPRGDENWPSYALVDTATGEISHRSTTYDRDGYAERLKQLGWAARPIDMLRAAA